MKHESIKVFSTRNSFPQPTGVRRGEYSATAVQNNSKHVSQHLLVSYNVTIILFTSG